MYINLDSFASTCEHNYALILTADVTSLQFLKICILNFSYSHPSSASENYLQFSGDGIIFAMSSNRSLLSLGLQKEVLAALTRNGYENIHDLISTTAEGLAKGKTYTPN